MAFKLRRDVSGHTTLAYREPPLSGNTINGVGETEWRQARHVFHNDGDDPAAMTEEIRARAQALGAGLVGVTRIRREHVYEGHDVPYANAISIGVVMDRDRMQHVPDAVRTLPLLTMERSRSPSSSRALGAIHHAIGPRRIAIPAVSTVVTQASTAVDTNPGEHEHFVDFDLPSFALTRLQVRCQRSLTIPV